MSTNVCFLKKQNLRELAASCQNDKNFELFLSNEDVEKFADKDDAFGDMLQQVGKTLYRQHALVLAVHCPHSKWPTQDRYCPNDISLCETLQDAREFQRLVAVCDLAIELSRAQFDGAKYTLPITVILHEGCQRGCCPPEDGPLFGPCIGETVENPVAQLRERLNNHYREEDRRSRFRIGIENLPPFQDTARQQHAICEKSPDRMAAADWLTEEKTQPAAQASSDGTPEEKYLPPVQIGLVLDYCHVQAAYLLEREKTGTEQSFGDWLKLRAAYPKKQVFLCHLSRYDPSTGLHGMAFLPEDPDLDTIRAHYIHQGYSCPITLEVTGQEDPDLRRYRFDRMVLSWSCLHGLFRELLDKDLENLFDLLYRMYDTQADDLLTLKETAFALRELVLKKQTSAPRLFDFTEEVELELPLLRVMAYIYYMRFAQVALYLQKHWPKCPGAVSMQEAFSPVLSAFVFQDDLAQICYNGLLPYHRLPFWIHGLKMGLDAEKPVVLFRFNDNVSSQSLSYDTLKICLKDCCSHIVGHPYAGLQSSSKHFGRCLYKYYNPEYTKSSYSYTLQILRVPALNCVLDPDGRVRPLQTLSQDKKNFCAKDENFCIDFSQFYSTKKNVSDDDKEALTTMTALFQELEVGVQEELMGSMYDQEVILKNSRNIAKNYHLNKQQVQDLAVLYELSCMCYKKYGKPSVCTASMKKCLRLIDSDKDNMPELIRTKSDDLCARAEKAGEILSCVDFAYETSLPIDESRVYNGEHNRTPLPELREKIRNWLDRNFYQFETRGEENP